MKIGGVLYHIPDDLTLATKKSRHTSLPHLVILPIKVRRIQTPFLVSHLWILIRITKVCN
jgi:hypothetical protein